MIHSKKELKFYIMADTMINRGYFKAPFYKRIAFIFFKDIVVDFLGNMRKYSYYSHQSGLINYLYSSYYKWRFLKLSRECGFSIGADCFGFGLLIHHYGTIVCGGNNRIGNFAVLNTSTCIVQNGSQIGDFFFMGSGAIISKRVELGDNVKVAANSTITKDFHNSNIVIAGNPGVIKKETSNTWIEEYGPCWKSRYNKIIDLKRCMGL